MSVSVIQGHSLDVLKGMPDEMFNCIITSPPYWGLRDYNTEPLIWDAKNGCEHLWRSKTTKWHGDRGNGDHKEVFCDMSEQKSDSAFCSLCSAWKGSLGLEPTFQLYISHLMQIMGECKRVLRKDGTMWVNIGDSYGNTSTGGNGYTGGRDKSTLASKMPPIGTTPVKKGYSGLPPKSLIGIPERFALAMTDELGLIRRNTIIWHKPNCMPSSATDRFTVDFEYVYFFTKNGKYWFEQQKEPNVNPARTNYKPGKEAYSEGNVHDNSGRTRRNDGFKAYAEGKICEGRNPRCVRTIPTKPYKEAHYATFPPTLIEPMIKSGCPVDGWVCDPFGGSGTVGMMANKLGRNAILIELSDEYCGQAERRIENGK